MNNKKILKSIKIERFENMDVIPVENACEHCFFCGFVNDEEFPCTNCKFYRLKNPQEPIKNYFLDEHGSAEMQLALNKLESDDIKDVKKIVDKGMW